VPQHQHLVQFRTTRTGDETGAAALPFVRKLSGFNRPSRARQAAFELAVEEVATVAATLIGSLVAKARHAVRG
jgi:hypothetical protein